MIIIKEKHDQNKKEKNEEKRDEVVDLENLHCRESKCEIEMTTNFVKLKLATTFFHLHLHLCLMF